MANNALSFDGANGYVAIGTANPSNTSLTVGAWINWGSINAGTTAQAIVTKHDLFSGATMKWWFGLDKTNSYKVLIYGDGGAFPFFNFIPPSGTPTHLVWVHNTTAGSETLYVNGTLNGNIAGVTFGTSPVPNIQIGASSLGTAERFKGTIDGVFINTGTLSAANILNIFNGVDPNSLSGAWSTWHFDEGSGTTTADSTGGRTGNLSGATIPAWVAGIETVASPVIRSLSMLGVG
jgi:hypothetical protein